VASWTDRDIHGRVADILGDLRFDGASARLRTKVAQLAIATRQTIETRHQATLTIESGDVLIMISTNTEQRLCGSKEVPNSRAQMAKRVSDTSTNPNLMSSRVTMQDMYGGFDASIH
jgi:hypothetical protein